jgi:Secretion system C-terminal sorting domain
VSGYSNEMSLDTRFNHRPVLYARIFPIDPLLPTGTVVDTLWADDADLDQELSFYLAQGNICTAFSVDPLSGEIRVKDAAQMDYWFTGVSEFRLLVGVRDNGSLPARDSVEVVIRLKVSTGMRHAPLPHEPRFRLYPNPATSEVNIVLEKAWTGQETGILILGIDGRILLRETISATGGREQRLDLSGLPSGLYSVVLESTRGRAVQRLVLVR